MQNRSGWWPYALATVFPLAMWSQNRTEDPAAWQVAVTMLAAWGATLGAGWLVRRLVRTPALQELTLAGFLVGAFGYGHAYALLTSAGRIEQRWFVTVWIAVWMALVAGLWAARRTRAPAALVRFGRAASWVLVAMVGVAAAGRPGQTDQVIAEVFGDFAKNAHRVNTSDRRPDIYYIILDGYVRADVLGELCGFDNGPFLEELRRRGFYVADEARSNYAQTRLSLASSLSMDYLPEYPAADAYEPHHEEIRRLRKESRVVARLRELGYRYRYVGSMYHPVDAAADEELSPFAARSGYLSEFLKTTIAAPVWQRLTSRGALAEPVAIFEYQMAHIAAPKDVPGPLHTFAHIACPHAPYVFNRHGPLAEPIDEQDARPADYAEQVEYLNGRVLALLEQIERMSGPDAVVILQADHGAELWGMPRRPSDMQYFARMSILNAYRVPESVRSQLDAKITPVNSFRVLFAGLFGDELPRLEDRALYSAYETPFEYVVNMEYGIRNTE